MVVPLVLDRSIVDLKLEDATAVSFAGGLAPSEHGKWCGTQLIESSTGACAVSSVPAPGLDLTRS